MPRGVTGISALPISLQTLVEATEYPPEIPTLLQVTTTKVVMIVDTVSPTPFALLRRAKNFEYRDEHWHLQEFANYEDPIRALTEECLRVLNCISSTNQSNVSSSKQSTSLRDASWSRFEDIGFGASIESDHEEEENKPPARNPSVMDSASSMRTAPQSQSGDLGRPTTPSWADFMSSGFSDETTLKAPAVGPMLLPPDKVLPPIAATRGQSSQSHKRNLDSEPELEPAELASINTLDMDDSFWWVWITSLSGDEPISRKAVFGRCALLETKIRDTKWLVLEEQVKGAAPEPEAGAQFVEKKRFFSFGSRKSKLSRRKSSAKKVSVEESYKRPNNQAPQSKTSIGPDQHKRIQAAAAALQKKHREQDAEANQARTTTGDDRHSSKTNSVMTLQPGIVNEASSAMKWANNYDKNAFRAAYLSNTRAGTGAVTEDGKPTEPTSEPAAEKKPSTPAAPLPPSTTKDAPAPPPKDNAEATPLPPSPEPSKKTAQEPTKEPAKEPAKEPVNEPAKEPTQEPVKEPVKKPAPQEEKKKPTKTVVLEEPAEIQQPQEDTGKKSKKKTGNVGLKSMFGAGKKKAEQPPMKNTGAKETSSVAAARAALEAKTKAAQETAPVSPPKPAPLKKKPVPAAPAPEAPAAAETQAEEPAKPSTPQQSPEPVADQQPPAQLAGSGSPPQTRRAVEADALSRVDTNERNAADQEFSKFDQGPLVEQPAFVPEDLPETPTSGAHADLPQTPANGQETKSEVNTSPEFPAAEQDRWTQIRKNAAERAGLGAEESEIPTEEPEARTSQSEQTDEGDTSSEESKSCVSNCVPKR